MGSDKAMLHLQGATLVERAVGLLRSLGFTPAIAGSRDDLAVYAPVLHDRRPGCGPLSGIEAGLRALATSYALFVPVDLPLLPAVFLQQLMNRVLLTGSLLTVPRFHGREQPLCAVYHRDLLPAVSRALDAGDYKVMRVMEKAALDQGGSQASDRYDVETTLAATGSRDGWPRLVHYAFLNCNTPADFQLLENLAVGATDTLKAGSIPA